MTHNIQTIDIPVDKNIVDTFRVLAERKVLHECWIGRNVERKSENFLMCWLSEFAWQQILGDNKIRYAYWGLFVGPVELSHKEDFILWLGKQKVTLGIRSRTKEQLLLYKEVPYPDDRFRLEKEIIADYVIISSIDFSKEPVIVSFYGAIANDNFLKVYDNAKKKYSPSNQENFRLVPLSAFSYDLMQEVLKRSDRTA